LAALFSERHPEAPGPSGARASPSPAPANANIAGISSAKPVVWTKASWLYRRGVASATAITSNQLHATLPRVRFGVPADPHHLRFSQSLALGCKVSDEFTVPLCRGHHREVNRCGDEGARLYALLKECGFEPLHYTISERHRVCMEVISRRVI
jgi:hypothetical protein